ncbi:MAG: ATPase, T2SS/T4P/T4SS family [Planctomycetota bacterium]|nr:ATPase, T2SS/T4P/T4SS family [Planctomycetota bacterium]MDA1113481.1 ATPase, T2SS/T4P/T4SS family [Planctomycetota bacterium]
MPAVLNRSRAEDLTDLWDTVQDDGITEIDGGSVTTLDSSGLALLLDGLRRAKFNGLPVTILNPTPPLMAARRAFNLYDLMMFPNSVEDVILEAELGMRLGEVLIEFGYLTKDTLENAVKLAEERPDTYLGQVLVEEGHISEEQLARALAMQHGLPYVDPLAEGVLDVSLDCEVPFAELRVHGILPYLRLGETVAVSLKDPADVYAADVVRKYTGLSVITTVATPQAINSGLDQIQRAVAASGSGETAIDEESVGAEERFNEIVINAIIEGASDIHIEPSPDYYMLRYRVDGRLHEVTRFNPQIGHSLVARIKVVAGCDISEKRLPQDGRIHYKDRIRDVDLRVNTLPTVNGEKAVMRILDRTTTALALDKLGLTSQSSAWLNEAVHLPHGMVLVTGPTGSGKTTTLYSVLDEIVNPETNVSTVENPVERAVKGVNQTQINEKAGLKFDVCLRALLRQDPDVIMIGEIRDHETAEIAIEAALTGHLVLATLHTNDAPGAASRLIQMGMEPFLVAATLRCVVAQRLVRRLCDSCKKPVAYPQEVVDQYEQFGLSGNEYFSAAGCPSCRQTGYDGRRGIFEVMKVTDDLQDLIATNPSSADIRRLALKEGMSSLLRDGIDRTNRGVTTLEEAIRAGGKS